MGTVGRVEMVGSMTPVFSDAWYRAAALRPMLRAQVRIHRHSYRGQRWHVVQDLTTGQFLRFDPVAYRAIGWMDGQRTVEDIWHALVKSHGDDAPSQDALLRLLTQLYRANLLRTDRREDAIELVERGRRTRWNRLKAMFQNPLSVRVPLFSPDRVVGAAIGWVPSWLWRVLLLAWMTLIITGVVLAGMHWPALTSDLSAQIFTPEKMLSLLLIFPVLKAIHELGHCIAIKAQGGAVHEVGVMFLIFVPIPYVEASQSYAFASKWRRMLVGASGMLIEVGVAAVAMLLWVDATEGVFKSVMHQVMILASVTTLIFNANPLLRFDGYYILSDWLEMPNLAARANQFVQSWVKRRVFGVQESSPQETAAEARWLVPYAFASHAYRLFVTFSIVLLVAENYLAVGLVLAALSLWGAVLKPVLKFVHYLATGSGLVGFRVRAWLATLATLGVGGALAFGVPVSSATVAQGVIWGSERSSVHVPVSCFGDRALARAGQWVRTGEPLFVCSDPGYQAEVALEAARLDEVQRKQDLARITDRVEWSSAQSQARLQQERLRRARERARDTVVVSPHDGWFVPVSHAELPGRYLPRGEVIAHVIHKDHLSLATVVGQGQIDLVRQNTRSVQVRLAEDVWRVFPAQVVREVPSASRELPSKALALEGGGTIGLDPQASSQQGKPVAMDHFFQFEIRPVGHELPQRLGGRAHVRFEHAPEPLAWQWYRELRQMLLRRFDV